MAVAKWYELGRLSQGKVAEIIGLSREEFLLALSRLHISPFQYTADDLARVGWSEYSELQQGQ
jgi:predicted HTH domain antitoxin